MVKNVLDNPKQVKGIDKSDMLRFCAEASKHYGEAAKLASKITVNRAKPKAIVVVGMGGSAIGGELLKDWSFGRVRVPVDICRDYRLPAYTDEDTLVIVVSYSGETEESLSAFADALKRRCMVHCVSSGGALQEFAERLSIASVLVPSGISPRASLPYLFVPLLVILEKMGLVRGVSSEIDETTRTLKQVCSENSLSQPSTSNPSKKLALSLFGTVPIVYGFSCYRSVAQRFKTQFNENSKSPAKWEYFPELDHNEIVGWEKSEEFAKCFSVIFIRDDAEEEAIRRRIEVTKQLMPISMRNRFLEVHTKGRSTLAKMCSVICVGDFASVYLSVLRGVDPTPVKTIDVLKDRLKESGVKERVMSELEKLV